MSHPLYMMQEDPKRDGLVCPLCGLFLSAVEILSGLKHERIAKLSTPCIPRATR